MRSKIGKSIHETFDKIRMLKVVLIFEYVFNFFIFYFHIFCMVVYLSTCSL